MARGFFRKPSFNKTLGAWGSQWKRALKRFFIPWYGKKGTGWWSNPRKALYNWWYQRTSISVFDLFGKRSRGKSKSKGGAFFFGVAGWLLLPAAFVAATTHMGVSKVKKAYTVRREGGGARLRRSSGGVGKKRKGAANTSSRSGALMSEKRAATNGATRVRSEKNVVQTSSKMIEKDTNAKETTVCPPKTATNSSVQGPISGTQSSAKEIERGIVSAEQKPIIKYPVLTSEEMRASKLSVVKEGESDVKPLWDGEKSLWVIWNENIDRFFADCEEPLREGKEVCSVRDLMFTKGRITSKVDGDKVVPYKVIITIEPMEKDAIKAFYENGKPIKDLFPTKKDFWLFCNCDKQQEVCKHMIATLCAFGKLLDEDVEKLYCLRGVNL